MRVVLSSVLLLLLSTPVAAQHAVEEGPIADVYGGHDYEVLESTVAVTSSYVVAQQLINGENADLLYERATGRITLLTPRSSQDFYWSPEVSRQVQQRKNRSGGGKRFGPLFDLVDLLFGSNQSAKDKFKESTCEANFREGQETIRSGTSNCAAARGTFRLINGGDACGAGIVFVCEIAHDQGQPLNP